MKKVSLWWYVFLCGLSAHAETYTVQRNRFGTGDTVIIQIPSKYGSAGAGAVEGDARRAEIAARSAEIQNERRRIRQEDKHFKALQKERQADYEREERNRAEDRAIQQKQFEALQQERQELLTRQQTMINAQIGREQALPGMTRRSSGLNLKNTMKLGETFSNPLRVSGGVSEDQFRIIYENQLRKMFYLNAGDELVQIRFWNSDGSFSEHDKEIRRQIADGSGDSIPSYEHIKSAYSKGMIFKVIWPYDFSCWNCKNGKAECASCGGDGYEAQTESKLTQQTQESKIPARRLGERRYCRACAGKKIVTCGICSGTRKVRCPGFAEISAK